MEQLVKCLIFSGRVRFAVESGVILAEDRFTGCRHVALARVFVCVFISSLTGFGLFASFEFTMRADELRFNTKWVFTGTCLASSLFALAIVGSLAFLTEDVGP